ncbi:PREDICTED: protein FAR1-RELATED SEQUENCE 5-like [Ipomoea nil]|uniref:protein FAR1-RELATED SEQUENCE 5-like n=1 Tax=Ipomoea nil TaxID=35883 RepID=UPI000900CF4C|nr:PREDICTED: protein FAR1-RELATED SEQUENCE 5-like [Ipomoea nil]
MSPDMQYSSVGVSSEQIVTEAHIPVPAVVNNSLSNAHFPSDLQSLNNPSLSPSSSNNGYTLTISPGMTQYWTPHCEDEIKPVADMTFKTLDADAGEGPSHPKRQRVSNRTGCRARIIFKYIGVVGYQVKTFIEKHNHNMSSVLARQFLKGNRNISIVHQKFILDCGKANIGASKSHEMCPAFAFHYEVDEDKQMSRLFWADPMSKKNFAAFGDVVSFDATYSTNRYNMAFTPFTEAMGMETRIIVTDQDPAMKVAIPRVFKQARHRYCMWHIMCKVGEKVGPMLNKNEEFKNTLNSIVWTSSLEPTDFEKQWRELMEMYNLVKNNCFTTMFEARNHWIPAYFRDVFMGGLLRTTSRSESENYTYNRFTGPQSSLVEFMMNFDSALKSQRNTNAKLNSDNEGNNPDMKTPLGIEKHASIVYTITVFYQVQEEICASCFKCMVLSVREDGGMLHYDIMDGKNKIFSVVHNVNDHEATCSCKMFEMNGPKDAKKMLLNKLWADVHCCIDLAGSNMEQLAAFLQVINEQKQLLMSGKQKLSPQHSRKTVIESFCGSTEISEINILPPKYAKNKGSGKHIKSIKELAMEKEKGSMKAKKHFMALTAIQQGETETLKEFLKRWQKEVQAVEDLDD